MSPGLVHPGTWVMTRRDTQITWLIRFSAAWKQLPEHDQQALAADPWKLKEFTGQVDAPWPSSAQMALLHLAHPATFDSTVSADHKRWITSRFADVAGTSPDVDRRMLAAREALTPVRRGLQLVRRLARAPVVEERQGLEAVPGLAGAQPRRCRQPRPGNGPAPGNRR